MPDAPRVLVAKMRGGWRWMCSADHRLNHMGSPVGHDGHPVHYGRPTTADEAHDDGREHARHCAALRLAKLTARLEREQQRLLARAKRTREWAQTATQLAAEMKWDAVSEEAYLGHSYLLDIIRECEATDA